MRHPLARSLVAATFIFTIGALLFRSNTNVKSVIVKTAVSASGAISLQKPLGFHRLPGWGARFGAPVEKHPGGQMSSPVAPTTHGNASGVAMICDYDMERLRQWQQRYQLEETFEYAKRYVQVSRRDIPRKSVTELPQKLLVDAPRVVDIHKQYEPEKCPEPLVAPVPRSPFPAAANASDFMFGVSTTYQRFTDPRTSPVNEWSYWLTDGSGHSNGGKLVLMLLDASDAELQEARRRLAEAGIDADVRRSDASLIMAVRYLALVPQMYAHPERSSGGKKWLVVCDDDTFFPSLHALADRLAEYDHERPMYVGALSEDVNNVARHGSQAFGGAGVFLSVPMARLVADRYDACRTEDKVRESDTGWGPQGDILLRKCIYEHSDVRLTVLRGLWQLDVMGDASGFYESGVRPLSLHHFRGGIWHVARPWQSTKVAHACGEACALQRFRTADGFVVANGYSVALYPRGIDFDLGQVEATFHAAPEDRGWNLDFALGPQRPSLHRTGRKMAWDLLDAARLADGCVSQVYVRRRADARWALPDGEPMAARDGVIELVWMPDKEL